MTAIGTIAVAVAAVGIAIWSDWRTGKRIADEREAHEKEIAAERTLADERLAKQLAHSDAQLAEERAAADKRLREELEHSAAQLQEERQVAQDREQWAEAYLVEVTEARMEPEAWGSRITTGPDTPIECPAAIVINRGHYTITHLQAQICMNDGSMTSYGKTEHFTSWWHLPQPMIDRVHGAVRDIYVSTLTPADLGMRFSSDAITVRNLVGSYPVIRWKDRWGTRWEHKQGVVRKITESEGGW